MARLMQGVPLSAGAKIRAGAKNGRLCARCHPPTATGDAKISFQFDTPVISKAANPDSHTPEGIMWRQPKIDSA